MTRAQDPVRDVLQASYVRTGDRYGSADAIAAGMAVVLAAGALLPTRGPQAETVARWAGQLLRRENEQGLFAGAGAVPHQWDPALSDPAGYASALYGVARKCLRWGAWVENQPHWFVIDHTGTLTFMLEPKFDTPTAYEKDVDLVLEALKEAARRAKK